MSCVTQYEDGGDEKSNLLDSENTSLKIESGWNGDDRLPYGIILTMY